MLSSTRFKSTLLLHDALCPLFSLYTGHLKSTLGISLILQRERDCAVVVNAGGDI